MAAIPEKKRVELQIDALARFIAMLINVSVEECGEQILDKFEEGFYEMGTKLGEALSKVVEMPEGEPDAVALSKLVDYADSIMGYDWEYVEKTPKKAGHAFAFCSRFMTAWGTALMRTANPKAVCTFTHYIPKGDDYCLGHFEISD